MFLRRQQQARKWKLVLVSHTHWDREWYFPFQRFRAMLVEAVDRLLVIMAARADYLYFTLDGQTIVLEDYLEVRPEREIDLRQLISQGRILIGPWYVMPDEFLVSGESLVRNLLEGRSTASRFGPVMMVGYVPDPFGHIAQMPQILRGFGIDSAVLWRGIGSELRETEAIWEAPDGSRVLLEHLYGGYDNAGGLPSSPDALMERISQIRAELEPRATTNYLLLMNGDDHAFPQQDIPDLIAEANRRMHDAEMIQGNLPMFIDAVREAAAETGVSWDTLHGELRSSELAHLLAGVLSSRIDLKQRNTKCQSSLERWAEPFSSYAKVLADQYQTNIDSLNAGSAGESGLLRLAWRYLLKNQPHDSICGCSVDQVHQEMNTRYDWCEQVAEQVIKRALDTLAGFVDTESLLKKSAAQGAIAVFNSETGPRTDFVTATAQLPEEPEEISLVTAEGKSVPFQILSQRHIDLASTTLSRSELQGYLRLSGPGRDWPRWKIRLLEKIVKAALRERVPELVVAAMDVAPGADPTTVEVDVEAAAGKEHDYDAISIGMRQLSNLVDRGDAQFFRLRVRRRDQVEIGFVAPDVSSYGLSLFYLQKNPTPAIAQPRHEDETTLENEYLSLQVSREDGSIRLIDRESGSIYWGINRLVDGGDAGDEYSYSPPRNDRLIEVPDGPPSIVREEDGPARYTLRVQFSMRLPERLTDDRQARLETTVECPVTTRISLYPGVPRVDIRTTFINNARDHRLRVYFPTHLNSQHSYADGHFAVIERPIKKVAKAEGWVEQPVTTNPQLTFVDVNDGESGLMIANRGLPEYDVVPTDDGPCIALTLLRCVGWLSRDDLTTRQGAAGPILPTPDAQMQGSHHFEYSIIPHAGNWQEVFHRAYWFARPLRARWTNRHPGPLGPNISFLSLSPSNLVLSAVKLADDGSRDLIIRLYNSTESPTEAMIRTIFPIASAKMSNLAEEPGDDLYLEEPHTLYLPVGGYQIVTLRLVAAKG